MRLVAALILALGSLLLLQLPLARAQAEVTVIFPQDGAVLAEPPPIIHMCFAEPVNIRDMSKGGDFLFKILKPDGSGIGRRVAFQVSGTGVDVHANVPDDPPDGEWTFEWRVTDPDTLEPSTGTIHFTVSPDGDPLPIEPFERCPGPSIVPGVTATASGAPRDTDADDGGGDQDILLLALATTGVAAGAAALGLFLYFLRRRLGLPSPHAPPPEGGPDGEDH